MESRRLVTYSLNSKFSKMKSFLVAICLFAAIISVRCADEIDCSKIVPANIAYGTADSETKEPLYSFDAVIRLAKERTIEPDDLVKELGLIVSLMTLFVY